ncbi:NACHT, LRR and PYD domains-containing protein 3 [Hyalella azteca]|uniref:NACHT, LRR and PYD domains-containing protein 3 n=1 Tax=Hyalella azteca TaxID=294128 RepID=A0A8B7PFX6_HYAAZ|nr:NACHT, LRR and PYD domains-containing protein 3 [Hyalella azteca]
MSSSAASSAVTHAQYYEEMKTVTDNVNGFFKLIPKYLQKLLNFECEDKVATQTYRAYMEKYRDEPFKGVEWKRCRGKSKKIDTATSPDGLDIIALYALFEGIYAAKNDVRDKTKMLEKLRAVKEPRNNACHEEPDMYNSNTFEEMKQEMFALLDEAKQFYDKYKSDIDSMKLELDRDIKTGFSPGATVQSFNCHRILTKGKDIAIARFQKYKEEALHFEDGTVTTVKRPEVFHPIKVMLQDRRLPFQDLFQSSSSTEQIVLISGEAGAGKTTLLMNIILHFTGDEDYLKSFEILVYIDSDTKSLHQVANGHFGDVCTELGSDEAVLEALSQLHVLFLVDGFDELNIKSTTVLYELLQKNWHPNSRILITTRPQDSGELKKFLSKPHVHKFSAYKMAPFSELSEQLKFIERYAQSLADDPASPLAMRKRFEEFDAKLQKSFTEPISLVHFCIIFKKSPEKINQWGSIIDVSRDRLELIKTYIEDKLIKVTPNNNADLMKGLFLIFCQWALKFLVQNKITFTADDRNELRETCCRKIEQYGALHVVDAKTILNVMLKVRPSMSGHANETYSFSHKSLQEILAAHFIFHKMKKSAEPVLESVGVTAETCKSLRVVLLFVVQVLRDEEPEIFKIHWPKLKEALCHSGVDFFGAAMNCVARCPGVPEMAELVDLTPPVYRWRVWKGSDVAAVASILLHAQARPQRLQVWMEASILRKEAGSWTKLLAATSGVEELELCLRPHNSDQPYDAYQSDDDLIEPLLNSGVRLVKFDGCVGTAAGVAALAKVGRDAFFNIHLATPVALSALKPRSHDFFTVWTRPLSPLSPIDPKWLLPASALTSLFVDGADEGAWEAAAHTISAFAFIRRKHTITWFRTLVLKNSRLCKADLSLLVKELHHRGIRTNHAKEEGTFAAIDKDCVHLIITDSLPRAGPAGPSEVRIVKPSSWW